MTFLKGYLARLKGEKTEVRVVEPRNWFDTYFNANKVMRGAASRETATIEDVLRWNREARLVEMEPKTVADLIYEKEALAREDDAIFMAMHQGDNMTDDGEIDDKYSNMKD